jgi:hypothetical protein
VGSKNVDTIARHDWKVVVRDTTHNGLDSQAPILSMVNQAKETTALNTAESIIVDGKEALYKALVNGKTEL